MLGMLLVKHFKIFKEGLLLNLTVTSYQVCSIGHDNSDESNFEMEKCG